MSNLGTQLQKSGLGIDLGEVNVSVIFFADDILLLGRSDAALNQLISITRDYFAAHKLQISTTKSKVMCYNATTGRTVFSGPQQDPLCLEEVLCYKYLGVPVSCSPYSLFRNYNEQVKKRAQSYLSSVLSLVKTGPDRSELAHTLWTCCALPSILYGSEVMPLTQATIDEVEKCQSQVGKFILQLPRSSASVASSLDAGLKPVWAVVAEKVLLYANATMSKSSDYWPRMALDMNISLGAKSPYTRYLQKWKTATNATLLSSKSIRISVNSAAVNSVLEQQKLVSTTTFAMSPPQSSVSKSIWFKPKPWVSDSCSSKIIARFRACNTSLGNRGPTKDGQFFQLCPLCAKVGRDAINNEVLKLNDVKVMLLNTDIPGPYAHGMSPDGGVQIQLWD